MKLGMLPIPIEPVRYAYVEASDIVQFVDIEGAREGDGEPRSVVLLRNGVTLRSTQQAALLANDYDALVMGRYSAR